MSQVSIYLPDLLAAEARRRAEASGKSLSAYVAEIVSREVSPQRWPKTLLDVLDHGTSTISEPEDLPPEPIDPLT